MLRMHVKSVLFIAMLLSVSARGEDSSKTASNLSSARLKLMRAKAMDFAFKGKDVPKCVEAEPLFRYDDLPRGYQDGTVWRLGKTGRPLAIVTTELHPRYGYHGTDKSNPCVVYDFLSLSPKPLQSRSKDIAWNPKKAAVKMKRLNCDVEVADTAARRLLQMKQIARKFKAVQRVSEPGVGDQQLVLRLLPQNIYRYQPGDGGKADAAIFLFVAGRMPGVVLVLETNGTTWEFGAGRLSGPSILSLSFNEEEVWLVPSDHGGVNEGYFATNAPSELPGE